MRLAACSRACTAAAVTASRIVEGYCEELGQQFLCTVIEKHAPPIFVVLNKDDSAEDECYIAGSNQLQPT